MSNAQRYRLRAAEYTRLAREAALRSGIKGLLRRAQYFSALAEGEEQALKRRGKSISSRAPATGPVDHAFTAALDRLLELDAA